MIIRLQTDSHPITCWKFCYVIHRLLKDGHRHVSHLKKTIDEIAYVDMVPSLGY